MNPQIAHRLTNEFSHFGNEFGVESRSPSQGRGKASGFPRGQTRQTFLMHEGGNAQARARLEAALLFPQPLRARHRVDGARAIYAAVVAETIVEIGRASRG